MILRLTVAALAALAAAPASAAADPWQAACAALDRLAPPDRPPATARLRPAAAAELARRGAAIGFSGSVLVATHGRVRLARGYGAADAGGARAMTPDTVIDIGSVSKQFTAAAVMHLAERGRLAPSDRIGRFLPDVPPDKNGITIHQLLTHGAGLPADADSVRTAATRADSVAAALAVPLAAAPGARHLYSNIGYVLLAAIVEAAAGQSYEEVLAPLWRKAGLRSTGWALARRPGLAAADGRNLAGSVATPDPATWRGDGPNWGRRGPGALLSTSRDLARWIAALRAGRVLSDASLRAMLAPHIREPGAAPSFYGYGWTVSRTPGGRCRIWHDGSNSRHFNALSVYPELDAVTHVASLEARSPVSAATLGAFEAVLFGTTAVALPDRQETRRRDVARLAGRFVDPEGAVLDLRAAGNRILVRATAPDAARLLGGFAPLGTDAETRIATRRKALPAILEGIGRTDLAPLLRQLPAGASAAEETGYWHEQVARWRTAYGPFAGSEVIATSGSGERVRSMALLHFARRSIPLLVEYPPAGGLAIGTSIAAGPDVDLLPLDFTVSRDPAGGYRIDNPALGGSVLLALSRDGQSLTLACPRGTHRLTRRDATQPNGALRRTTSQLRAAATVTQAR